MNPSNNEVITLNLMQHMLKDGFAIEKGCTPNHLSITKDGFVYNMPSSPNTFLSYTMRMYEEYGKSQFESVIIDKIDKSLEKSETVSISKEEFINGEEQQQSLSSGK